MMIKILLFLICLNTYAQENKISIYAASSLSNVLQVIAKEYKGPRKIVFNFDASSKLAKQIESGAPADLFFSADSEWVDFLDKQSLIIKSSRVDLVTNKLVVIVPQTSKKIPIKVEDLADDFYHHISLAGEAVPAGKFARAALNADNILTPFFNKKIVNADNVRVALSWVASGEAAAGIVYATDVLIEPKVKIAFAIKENTYPKIVYPGAIIAKSKNLAQAQKFLEFCKSKKAQEIFEKAGFINL